ncbi:hypothetical protein HPO96_26735 [Kribbella sandramycini]|uniref:Uncharacterized protein n=1 Tax=Kribbella sandramycini TaxID=60450 RepID=A0A7Y4P383_9ACTN|nr:hypothetical protein [Kribbella sandramycini]MBB6570706.1 hypothetical protein [Kribbella sandramycini]NOL43850.1 hypothetical protein [Kribbella sandramycini]
MYDPEDYPEIQSWVSGWDGPLDYVDYLKDQVGLAALVAFAAVLSPRFLQVEGCVLWERSYDGENFAAWRAELNGDVRRIESTLNQLRVWEIVGSNETRADMDALRFVAEVIARCWRAALREEFPERGFEVGVVASVDGPKVTFCSAPV